MLKKALTITTLGLAALTVTEVANARHHGGGHGGGHHHGGGGWVWGSGFYFGAPYYPGSFYSPYYSPYYYPYYPPSVVTVPVEPPTYIERERPVQQPQQLPEGYWYFCSDPEGYYPYVKECPGGWRQVDPIPPQ